MIELWNGYHVTKVSLSQVKRVEPKDTEDATLKDVWKCIVTGVCLTTTIYVIRSPTEISDYSKLLEV